jgi:hypothetical protein
MDSDTYYDILYHTMKSLRVHCQMLLILHRITELVVTSQFLHPDVNTESTNEVQPKSPQSKYLAERSR